MEFSQPISTQTCGNATTPTTKVRGGRLAVQSAVAFCANILAAPASLLLGTYLKDDRGFSGGEISLFTLLTGTPGGIGLIIGGKLADRYGRRMIGAVCVPAGAALTVISFSIAGVVFLISDLMLSTPFALVAGLAVWLVAAVLWWGLPLGRTDQIRSK